MLERPLALGAYEKQVILELDKQLTLIEARVFYYASGARVLSSIITDSWERRHTVEECLLIIHSVRLLLFQGIVPLPDAIAAQLDKLNSKATAYSCG